MMRKKILSLALFVGAMSLLTAAGVLAASPAVSNSHPTLQDETPTPTITPTVTITNPVAIAIANFFSNAFTDTYTVTVQSVLDLRAGGMGYGEIARCFFLAHFAGVSPTEILAQRGEGEEKVGWGIIMRQFGFRPGRDRNLGAIMSGRATPVPEPPDEGSGDEVESASTKGPPHQPKGWEQGKGRGLGRDKDKGHGKGHKN